MRLDSKSLLRAGAFAALGLWLIALPAGADPKKKKKKEAPSVAQCEAQCNEDASEQMETCINECPAPRGESQVKAFQKCARGCSEEAARKTETVCKKRCEPKDKKGTEQVRVRWGRGSENMAD